MKSCMVLHTDMYFHVPQGNGSMVMAKKIVFEIIADSDCTTFKMCIRDSLTRICFIKNSEFNNTFN